MINKTDLTAMKNRKGGTRIVPIEGTWSARFGVQTLVVKDLFDRSRFNKADEIGVGPADRGVAWGVKLSEIRLAD